MKIQIDTEQKAIRLESNENLGEFIAKVKLLFPEGEWKSYTLETNVSFMWSNPITWEPYQTYPWYNPYPYTTLTTGGTDAVTDNVYSVIC